MAGTLESEEQQSQADGQKEMRGQDVSPPGNVGVALDETTQDKVSRSCTVFLDS